VASTSCDGVIHIRVLLDLGSLGEEAKGCFATILERDRNDVIPGQDEDISAKDRNCSLARTYHNRADRKH